MEKKPNKEIPDRPLECTECKKPIKVRYTEISGDTINRTSMCADCPELQSRLHGTPPGELIPNQLGVRAGLECGNCGTTLEEVRRGHRLGCAECYTIFEDVLLVEMEGSHRLLPRLIPLKKGAPLHIGRMPGQILTVNPSSRLLALNEALEETLNREDYEQAALLRDQIRALTEKENLTPSEKDDDHEQSK